MLAAHCPLAAPRRFPLLADPAGSRRSISLTGQYAVDDLLTGEENLEMTARLLRLPRRAARARADELLTAFGLADARHRRARTYSGGMRRRLLRDPEAFFTALILPVVLMLLFVYVFGGALRTGGRYVDCVVPGSSCCAPGSAPGPRPPPSRPT